MKDIFLIFILFLVFISAGVYMNALNFFSIAAITTVACALVVVVWWSQPNY